MKEKIIQIVKELNQHEADRLRLEGFTNECFFNPDGTLTEQQEVTFLIKKKYIYINFGTSGAFMVNRETGNIFNIKGYGTPDLKKLRGMWKTLILKSCIVKGTIIKDDKPIY